MLLKVGGINDRRVLTNDLVSENYLQVNCCGITGGTVEQPVTLRPEGRQDYQLVIVLEGRALFKYDGRDILLKNGEAILLPPKIKNHYLFYPDNNIIWIHFTGASVESILEEYAIEGYVKYYASDADGLLRCAEHIIDELLLKRVGYMHICNAELLTILTLIKRRTDHRLNSSSDAFSPELTAVLEDMKTHFAENKDITEFAKMCNLSPSRFAHLFTAKVGTSPYKYLLKLRIRQAKYLLLNTNLSVSDIAKSVGYDDPLHFSRIFKKHEGQSPTQYKKENKDIN